MARKDISTLNEQKTRTTMNYIQLPDELMVTYDLYRERIRRIRSMQTSADKRLSYMIGWEIHDG
jgi:hypothetical protein